MSRLGLGITFALRASLILLVTASGGCAPSPSPAVAGLTGPVPDPLLPPDEMMSCPAIADSFRYAARRVALLQHAVVAGASGFGTGQLLADAPVQIRQEEERLDALADLQRERGCPVMDPQATITAESVQLSPLGPRVLLAPDLSPRKPVVLHARG